MGRYAENTSVSTENSRAEIERTLSRYGADQFMYGWDREQAIVAFRAHDRQVRFLLPLPDRDDKEFWYTPSRQLQRSESEAYKLWEQACRQRWRALALAIKAKLEAVEADITSFEAEFLAHIVLPDGTTVGQWAGPQLEEVYRTGKMPPVLPALGPAKDK